jgi:uncharacterized coiled-coil protein SlyX
MQSIIVTGCTPAEQNKIDELAAYLFEKSADVQKCSQLIRELILRMRERGELEAT